MKKSGILVLFFVVSALLSAHGQDKVGGPCEGCEAIYENTVSFEKLPSLLKMPDVTWEGKKPLGINGIVYKADGKTPAAGVILYVYHTDQTGHYPKKGNETGWGKRHGYIRGWVRTDEKGAYKFVTLRPAPYPNANEPAHIHITVKEPDLNEYYIDEFLFDNDPLLTTEKRRKLENRGGSGIVRLKDVGNMSKGERNIYLGRNIPNYPVKKE
ncbi:intradiol ring-cleavage dioxygenase [Larkinella sp. VNQ87]|uniref:dioxygenase family protein n=1 Tax=Larkinella sp. VNQ87 TaxID=3400921 RepID=UPI003C08E9C6